MSENLRKVDHTALRINQACIIAFSVVAFILNAPAIALLVTLVMISGVLRKTPGFEFIYKHFLKPRGLVKADLIDDNPEPHRFAQGFGALVMALGVVAILGGLPVPGWSLIWLVIALAALNLFGGYCAGCAFYYWLARLNIPGFVKAPPQGTTTKK
jgi:hypothetical protein